MPKLNHAAVTALAALSLGGCQTGSDVTTALTRNAVGRTVFDLVGVTVPLSAGAMQAYNGSYQGNIRQIAANGPGCPTEHGEKIVMVGDGVLWYAYSPVIYFTSPVRYDGTIEATSGTARMTGRIKGDHLDATVKSATCETRLSMDYVYNHGS